MKCGLWLLTAAAWCATIEPQHIVLSGPGASQQLVVTGSGCRVTSTSTTAAVDVGRMVVTGIARGVAELVAACGTETARARVEVRDQTAGQWEPRFSPDVISVLTIKGCNGSGCHGSPAGQNGFKLSLFGYDVEADHQMVSNRVNLAEPEKSLLLRKPTFEAPHGGGRLMSPDSEEYRTLLSWLKQGAKISSGGARLIQMDMYPREAMLTGPQPIAVIGRMSDGTTRDMTREVRLTTADENVARIEAAVVKPGAPGMTTILARGMGQVAAMRVGIAAGGAARPLPVNNFIDTLTGARMQKMGVTPAALTSDAEFVRRVFLDAIGRPPLPEETRAFLAKPDRAALIESLLARPEYAAFWTVKFEDWFRNNQLNSQGRAMGTFKEWIRDSLRQDLPYDQMVRDILTSEGDSFLVPATAFWAPATDFMLKKFEVNRAVPTVTRLFLGVRLECAECHNHPLENFTQDDFYGLSAFFARMRVKHGIGEYRRTWYLEDEGEVAHPVTKKPVAPKLLGGAAQPFDGPDDRRRTLAEWITNPANPYFARATVNRIWHAYFQTGIVEPFDDLRMSNPPTNPELLDALAAHFVKSGYRLKALHRVILNSRTYQLSSRSAGTTAAELERMLFARYQPRKLTAEVLLDSLSQVAGAAHTFMWHPKGTRAMDVYMPDQPDSFLVTFGFPRRDILCERAGAPTLSQTLHLMNGKTIQAKVEEKDNILASWESLPDGEAVTALYERAFARKPNEAELGMGMEFLAKGSARRKALEGLLWATLVSKEFQLNY
ncbi:MAG TPA: DUF1549 and DUF1553 domain-containing protein [Bryobacteraceae bacterium]|nr:DUF1549 and DUF1553 domain-containing protein [Bryobacteraceae bacterium]